MHTNTKFDDFSMLTFLSNIFVMFFSVFVSLSWMIGSGYQEKIGNPGRYEMIGITGDNLFFIPLSIFAFAMIPNVIVFLIHSKVLKDPIDRKKMRIGLLKFSFAQFLIPAFIMILCVIMLGISK